MCDLFVTIENLPTQIKTAGYVDVWSVQWRFKKDEAEWSVS